MLRFAAFCVLSLVTVVRFVDSAVVVTTPPANDTAVTSPMSIREIEKSIEGLVNSISKMALPYFVRNSDLKMSPQCMSTIIKMFVDAKKLKVPVMKLLDAMAKPPFGMLKGTFSIMGDYDECLSISATKKGDVAKSKSEEYYHGQYCTVQVNFPQSIADGIREYGKGRMNVTDFGKLGNFIREFPETSFSGEYFNFHAGICIPSTCTVGDLEEVIKQVPISFVPIHVKRCESGEPKPIAVEQVIILTVLAAFGVIILIGTSYEGVLYGLFPSRIGKSKSKWSDLLLSFSIYNNSKKLLAAEKNTSSPIRCINGMYVMGSLLLIVYHTYFLPFFHYFSSTISNLGHFFNDPKFTLISTMGISIEAYFVFSAFFLVYGRFKREGDKPRVNVFMIILRRYLRLCPSMLLVLAFILVLPLIGSGPVWEDVFQVAAVNTKKYWWTYALMFNNFLPIKDHNFLYLWFIPCLFQLTVVAVILIWILSKCRRLGIFLVVSWAVACNITLGVLTANRGYPPSYAIYFFNDRENFEFAIYTSPLSHVTSFSIGILLGLYMSQNPIVKMSKVRVCVGWSLAFLLTVGTQLLLYICHNGRDIDPSFAAVYGSIHKTLFSLGIAWVILACAHGYGGILGHLLSWKGFGPLSKLGYLVYLVHYLVIAFHVSCTRNNLNFTHIEIWYRIWGYFVLSFMFAYVLYISFELPFNKLESLVLPRPKIEAPPLEPEQKGKDIIRFTVTPDDYRRSHFQTNLQIVTGVRYTENSRL